MQLRHKLVLATLKVFLRVVFRVKVIGLQNYPLGSTKPLLIISNHLSLLDAGIINAFMPERPMFLVNSAIARWWFTRFARYMAGNSIYALDQTNPLSIRNLIRYLQQHPGLRACIFPEGRLSPSGKLMKVYAGAGLIADKTGADILPIHIHGAELSKLHLLPKRYRTFWRPRVTATILPPVQIKVDENLRGRARRQKVADEVYALMSANVVQAANVNRTLFDELLIAAERHGPDHLILNDITFTRTSYKTLLLRATVLARKLGQLVPPGQPIGLMLPNAIPAVIAFFAVQRMGRPAALINFTSGSANILSGCKAAQISTIVTSKTFLEKANLQAVADDLAKHVKLVYLEDIRSSVTTLDKLAAAIAHRRNKPGRYKAPAKPTDAAVILFTSGSEGAPKGVALSHQNLLINRWQSVSRLDVNPADSIVNALPLFHSFGLGVATLMPLFEGVPLFLYPSPMHFRMVPEMVYDQNATITFGTDTFLSRYARFAHPFDFNATRYIFAGGERLRPETRAAYLDKFGIRLLEGYGVTETAPVIALNTAMQNRAGTVGKIVPGIEHAFTDEPGLTEGRRLHVKGPNVMLGYLKADAPGQINLPPHPLGPGWYDTGDVATLDADGYLTIVGRAKRFAKVGGEMVSLAAAEEFIAAAFPEGRHAVVALPDARKGEKLVLVTTDAKLTRQKVVAAGQERGLAEILLPREVKTLDKLPQLGTGKPDYPAILRLLQN